MAEKWSVCNFILPCIKARLSPKALNIDYFDNWDYSNNKGLSARPFLILIFEYLLLFVQGKQPNRLIFWHFLTLHLVSKLEKRYTKCNITSSVVLTYSYLLIEQCINVLKIPWKDKKSQIDPFSPRLVSINFHSLTFYFIFSLFYF